MLSRPDAETAQISRNLPHSGRCPTFFQHLENLLLRFRHAPNSPSSNDSRGSAEKRVLTGRL